MRLFIAGARSPTGKDLIEILRKRKIRFLAPPEKYFDPDNGVEIAKMVTDYEPTQLINLSDFISGNHSALRRAETTADRCYRINAGLPTTLSEIADQMGLSVSGVRKRLRVLREHGLALEETSYHGEP